MLFELATRKTLKEIEQGLHDAAARHAFGVIAVHNLKEMLQKKGADFGGECLIFEVCNPHQAKKVLEANAAISTVLPCRISVFRSGDAYKLATILPTAMLGMFGNPELEPVAREVEDVIVAMMKESA